MTSAADTHSPLDNLDTPPDLATRLQACLHRLEHILPAQAPLRDFVHHNTLHGFQHLPFPEALAEASRLTGARPWLDQASCLALYQAGRISGADLDAALQQLPIADLDALLFADATHSVRRRDVLRVTLRYPPTPTTPLALSWQREECAAFEALRTDLDDGARLRLRTLATREAGGEAALLNNLWAAASEVLGLAGAAAPAPDNSLEHLFDGFLTDTKKPLPVWEKEAAVLWRDMVSCLGQKWTLGTLLARLTGEDVRQKLQPSLIRHLAAHLDSGLAAWPNPARAQGFYAAWRHSAEADWSWGLDDLPGARREIAELPTEALSAIIAELDRIGPDESHWSAYLERLALELPGWSGMFLWRELHAGKATATTADQPPVAMLDYLAVRLVLERLYAEQLVRRIWGLPLLLSELGDYFLCHAAELWVRDACGRGELPEELLDVVTHQLNVPAGDDSAVWTAFARRLAASRASSAEETRRSGAAAWPLFILAQRLGLCGHDLRQLGASGAKALLECADSLSTDQRGHLWLLAYERHYREEIFSALRANHGRSLPLSAPPVAQLVFCMDDREEGTRRHLEEINPGIETFGAAGFFGVPMLWQGLDDAAPSALCPVVVRPQNRLNEAVAPGCEEALHTHRQRQRWRQRWQERLHQGSRRGLLQSALLIVGAAPLALLGLLGRTLAPGRLGRLSTGWRSAFDRPVAGVLPLTADAAESARSASADAPRQGFSETEQVERVAGFLRNIGLTTNFAPLIVIVGHGSDSRNNPHLAAYDCGACSGRHGGPNARVFAALANRPEVRNALRACGMIIPESTLFIGAEHNTCDESVEWYDLATLPETHRAPFAALCRDLDQALQLHAVERCRRFASAPAAPSPAQALQHLADRRQDIAQARPELGHATIAAAFIGRRQISRGAFFDRRVFLISYDPTPDDDGRVLEATLLAAGPVGAGISLEYYFSTVDNDGFGCGTKVMHNLAGLFGVMQGASSDLRTGLPRQMIEIHEAMRLLVVVEQTPEIVGAIYARQPALQELIGNGWIVLATQHPLSGEIQSFDPAQGWLPWAGPASARALPERERSHDWFAGHSEALSPALLNRPLAVAQ